MQEWKCDVCVESSGQWHVFHIIPTATRSPSLVREAHTFIQVGVGHAAAQLLDDVDGLQVSGSLKPHHGLHRQPGEVILVVRQELGGQRGARDVHQIHLELLLVVPAEKHTRSCPLPLLFKHTHHYHSRPSLPMIHRRLPERVAGRLSGLPPARDDDLRMDLLGDQQLSFLRHKSSHIIKTPPAVNKAG